MSSIAAPRTALIMYTSLKFTVATHFLISSSLNPGPEAKLPRSGLEDKPRLLRILRSTLARNKQLEQQVQDLRRALGADLDNSSGTSKFAADWDDAPVQIAGDVGHGTIIISHSVVTLSGGNLSTNTINSGQSTNIGSSIGFNSKPSTKSTTQPGFDELDLQLV